MYYSVKLVSLGIVMTLLGGWWAMIAYQESLKPNLEFPPDPIWKGVAVSVLGIVLLFFGGRSLMETNSPAPEIDPEDPDDTDGEADGN